MSEEDGGIDGPSCPVPFAAYERITLAHGGGGRVMHRLIDGLFRRAFADPRLDAGHDGALLPLRGTPAVTTDAFTVSPRFFPGGDIGSLAIHGTVNDLAMCGARPRYLAASFILEEGLPISELERIVASMAGAAREAGVSVVTGDTKVVEHGKADGIYIAVTGIGEVKEGAVISPDRVRPGDAVLVSGPVGDHGTAVMLAREGLELPAGLISDSASVAAPCSALLDAGLDVHCLRDPTRGGLATVLNEIAKAAAVGVRVEAGAVPVRLEVADACELLGLDPLYVACEGRCVVFLPEGEAERALEVLRAHEVSRGAALVGRVVGEGPGVVTLQSALGTERVLDLLSGEQLPRIC